MRNDVKARVSFMKRVKRMMLQFAERKEYEFLAAEETTSPKDMDTS